MTNRQLVQEFWDWLDERMTGLSGWKKRKATLWIAAIAAVIRIGTDGSTVHIADETWMDHALRSALAEQASGLVENGAVDEQLESHPSDALVSLLIGSRDSSVGAAAPSGLPERSTCPVFGLPPARSYFCTVATGWTAEIPQRSWVWDAACGVHRDGGALPLPFRDETG